MSRLPRGVRVALGLTGAIVLLIVLVAPIVLRGGGTACQRTLLWKGRVFTARKATVVQSTAIGTGVVRGCGVQPENVNIRSVEGISPAIAVALSTESGSVYAARGRCPRLADIALLACLRRQ
ncbi:MAG: hypothetical protein JOZ56_09630 [Actinobacteria bacterium]|nr:hypothetical protein [Actinomycetota bacterium]